jgi:hypothetical protein
MRAKADMLNELRTMLHEVFVARSGGVVQQRLARAQGYADGYMRALLETGTCSQQELLDLVSRERARVDGPAVAEVAASDEAVA